MAGGMAADQSKQRRRRNGKRWLWFPVAAAIILIVALLLSQVKYMKYQSEISRYLENSSAFCRIPGIEDGFIPQGLSYDPETDRVLLAGYMGSGGASPIYIVDRQSGSAVKVLMQTETGKNFKGHAGGLSLRAGTAYIAGSTANCVYCFSLDALLGATEDGALAADAKIELKNRDDYIRVSFTAENTEMLFAGEFHKAPLFYTHASHAVDTPDGRQKAYLFGFTPDEKNCAVPRVVYSIPDNVQGACFDGDYLYLSQTDGLLSARILCFDLSKLSAAGTKTVLNAEVPLYILGEHAAVKCTRIPPMSEEILVVDGNLLILYESASNRYRIGKKLGLDHVLATPIEFFR